MENKAKFKTEDRKLKVDDRRKNAKQTQITKCPIGLKTNIYKVLQEIMLSDTKSKTNPNKANFRTEVRLIFQLGLKKAEKNVSHYLAKVL